MREREDDGRLVRESALTEVVRTPSVRHHEESGEVVLVGLDALFQHLHAVEFGRILRADGRVSTQVFLADDFGTLGSVVRFHHLQVRVTLQEGMALRQRHRVGVYFGQCVPIILRQTDTVVLDAELVFAHDGHPAFAHQFVIVQEAACDGVLDGYQSDDRAVQMDVLEDFLAGIAADELDFLVREELVGCIAIFFISYFSFIKKSHLIRSGIHCYFISF